MRVLWIGTKSPWPPIDGGRLVAAETIRALVDAGVELTVAAADEPGERPPDVPSGLAGSCSLHVVDRRRRSLPVAVLRSLLTRRPVTVERHRSSALEGRVAELLRNDRFDVVHAEQIHALPQTRPAARHGLPIVLRAHNVESDLWAQVARITPLPARLPTRWEASRLARFEAESVQTSDRTIALSGADASELTTLSGVEVETVPPPFPGSLPVGDTSLPGDPPVVVLASGGWPPNVDAARWFVDEIWPAIARELPAARAHLFGTDPRIDGSGPSLTVHPAPNESREAFVPGSVLVVPLRVASGVRMKILEAWARCVPVVATRHAAGGLEARDGQELLLASEPGGFAKAIARLASDPELRDRLVTGGRALLRRRHDPSRVAEGMTSVYLAARG